MHSPGLAIGLLAAFSAVLGVSASPIDRRQDDASSSSSSSAPTAAVVVTTISGQATTATIAAPTTSSSDDVSAQTTTAAAASSTEASSSTAAAAAASASASAALSFNFPVCHDTSARPFCLPNNESAVYVGSTYYVTWDADFFAANSSITIVMNYANSSQIQAFHSAQTANALGYSVIPMSSEFLQGKDKNNLTVFAVEYDAASTTKAKTYAGPLLMLSNPPAEHYPPPEPTKMPNKQGLLIGLPVSLGFVALVVVGLFVGMRSRRRLGIGNIHALGRHGYGEKRSRRQRLGLGRKKGAIRLDERESMLDNDYRGVDPDAIERAPHGRSREAAHAGPRLAPTSTHTRDVSLGSLVSDGGEKGNAFRDELQRQQAGR